MTAKPTYEELEQKVRALERSESACRLAEKALRESEELHRITLSNISDAVFITDDSGVFTYICPNVSVIFGYSYEEVKSFLRIETLMGANIFNRAELDSSGHIKNSEHVVYDKSGVARTLLVDIKLVSIKGGTVLYTCRDITERRDAHAELLENEEKYRQLFNNASHAVMIFDARTHRFEDANPATLKLFGYSKNEFMGLNVVDISAEPSKTKVSVELVKKGAVERQYVPLRYFKKKDGVIFPGEIYSGTYYSKGRQKIIGAVQDISERLQAEESVRKLTLSLLTIQETERKRIALELHDDLGQTLALLKLQLINIKNNLPETQEELKDECQKTLGNATQLIEKIRKISHGLSPSSLDDLGLTVALQSLIRDFAYYLDIVIQKDIEDIDKLFSPITKITIYRIFQEIFTNIEKHANADHVKIEVKKQNGHVNFKIKDNGTGFDLESIKSKYPNEAGMGLASMADRVRMLGGRFAIQSQLSEGTEIDFSIPFR